MAAVMQVLAERGLFFLDSLTTPDSVAASAAAAAGVPVLRRAFFLDHDPAPEAIRQQLRRAAQRAQEAPAVAIAHPSQALVDVLRDELPRLHAAGIAVVPLHEVLTRASAPGVPGAPIPR